MQQCKQLLVVGMLLTCWNRCRGHDLVPGEIKLLGKIASLDAARKQFLLAAERFVLPPNREGVIKKRKNKLVTVNEKTVVCLAKASEHKLSTADLMVGMNVSVTGEDLGEGRPLPAREIAVWVEERREGEGAASKQGDKEPQPAEEKLRAIENLIEQVQRAKELLSLGNAAEARQAANEALQLEPANAGALGVLAQALLREERQEEAAGTIELALQKEPDNVEALFAAALLQELKGETQEAQRTWDRYLEADPESERAWQVRKGLVLVRRERVTDQGVYSCPAWSPDGQWLAFCQGSICKPLVVQRLGEPGKLRRLTPEGIMGWTPDWSPDGRRIAYMAMIPRKDSEPASVWGPQWKPFELHVVDVGSGSDVRLAPQLENACNPQWSRDGRSILVWTLAPRVVDAQTGKVERVRTWPGYGVWPAWSPDDKTIAWLFGPKTQHENLGVFDFQNGGFIRLTADERMKFRPAFAPDGTLIAYCSLRREDSADLFASSTDGSKKQALLISGIPYSWARDMGTLMPTWHPSGDRIAYPNGEDGLWVAYLGGKRQPLEGGRGPLQ